MGLHSARSQPASQPASKQLAPKNCTLHFSNTRGNMVGSKAVPSGPALDTCTSTAGVLELLLQAKPVPGRRKQGARMGLTAPQILSEIDEKPVPFNCPILLLVPQIFRPSDGPKSVQEPLSCKEGGKIAPHQYTVQSFLKSLSSF